MSDTTAGTLAPAPSRVRIVHTGGTLDVEMLPGSSTVLDLTGFEGKRRRGIILRTLGFVSVVAMVAGVGYAASTALLPLLSRTAASTQLDLPAPAGAVQLPRGATAEARPSPDPSRAAGTVERDPFGLRQR